jgi:AhpC/TSA family protein
MTTLPAEESTFLPCAPFEVRTGRPPRAGGNAGGAPAIVRSITPRSALHEEIDMVKVGDVAPSFKAKNHKGQDVELGKLKGKTVVLWFYPRADTPG